MNKVENQKINVLVPVWRIVQIQLVDNVRITNVCNIVIVVAVVIVVELNFFTVSFYHVIFIATTVVVLFILSFLYDLVLVH